MDFRGLALDSPGFLDVAEMLIRDGKRISFRATGISMKPFIADGDVVTVMPLRTVPRTGDVVLCRTPGGNVLLHRVVGKSVQGFVTRGDACRWTDGIIPPGNVLGTLEMIAGKAPLHLRFPIRLIVVARPALARALGWIPGARPLGRLFERVTR